MPLTDEQLAAIRGRLYRGYPISFLDVRALMDEILALRAERDRYKAAVVGYRESLAGEEQA